MNVTFLYFFDEECKRLMVIDVNSLVLFIWNAVLANVPLITSRL